MKKYTILALVLVLCVTMFAGCRNRNDVNNTTLPSTGVTTTPTAPTTRPTTQPTTEATRETTMSPTESMPEVTTDNATDDTGATDMPGGMEGRARGTIPGRK